MAGTTLLAGGIGTGFLVGGIFGTRHAFEADHVAAVATLVKDEDHPATTGMAWGIGHSLPILLLGCLFLVLDVQIPDSVGTAFELLVAVVLVALGFRVLAGRESLGIAVLRHAHDTDRTYSDGDHRHLTIGGKQIGLFHSHENGESLVVGIVHGLAGSGGVVIALAAASQSVAGGASFLFGFSIASVLAMSVASWVWGRAIDQARNLRVLAGVASVIVGVALFAETVGFVPSV
jgi:hypothetical protein